jgi:hypothetical protein
VHAGADDSRTFSLEPGVSSPYLKAMPFRGKCRPAWLSGILTLAFATGSLPAFGSAPAMANTDPAEAVLGALHPDYLAWVQCVRPLQPGDGERASVYMALVRQGAGDVVSGASAPLLGAGARNDIVYDPAVLGAGRSVAWVQLLLDHEYFHARHLAGGSIVPLPSGLPPAAARHYYEAAAWGYTVARARSGAYPGLSENEFREALDRYGDHARALRQMTGRAFPETLLAHALLSGSPAPSAAAPEPLSARDR